MITTHTEYFFPFLQLAHSIAAQSSFSSANTLFFSSDETAQSSHIAQYSNHLKNNNSFTFLLNMQHRTTSLLLLGKSLFSAVSVYR